MPLISTEKSTGIRVLDEEGFGMWPHLFTTLFLRYRPPEHFLISLLYLWEATVGHDKNDPAGHLAFSQIPVREREAYKWVAAFCAIGFFTVTKPKQGEKKGSFYEYNVDTAPGQWEALFAAAAALASLPCWDEVSPERFSKLVKSTMEAEWLVQR